MKKREARWSLTESPSTRMERKSRQAAEGPYMYIYGMAMDGWGDVPTPPHQGYGIKSSLVQVARGPVKRQPLNLGKTVAG